MASLYERPTTDYHRGIHSTNKMRQHVAEASKPGHIAPVQHIQTSHIGGVQPGNDQMGPTWSQHVEMLRGEYPRASKRQLEQMADLAMRGQLPGQQSQEPSATTGNGYDAPRPRISSWNIGEDGIPQPVYENSGKQQGSAQVESRSPHSSTGMADSKARIDSMAPGSDIRAAGFQVAPNLYQQNQQSNQRGRIMDSLKSKRYSQPGSLSPDSQSKADAFEQSLPKDGSSDRFSAPNKITVTPLEVGPGRTNSPDVDTPGKKLPTTPPPTYQRPTAQNKPAKRQNYDQMMWKGMKNAASATGRFLKRNFGNFE